MVGKYPLYIFVLCLLAAVNAIYPLPQPVIDAMTTREMRYHHLLWHNVRNSWNRLDGATQRALEALGWGCPRPSQTAAGVALEDNNSGEDFLFMHRQMVRRAREISDANPQNPPFSFRAWDTIPPPGDYNYPVPPPYDAQNVETTTSTNEWKTDEMYDYLVRKDARLKDPNYLRTVTLGQLGSNIEYTLHNGLHMRWSDVDVIGIRPRPPNPVPEIESRWNSMNYTWLIDSYASHVNPYFYKIHLYIDARVEDWRRANGLAQINWVGTWTGGPMTRVSDLIQTGEDHNLRVQGAQIAAPGSEHNHDGSHGSGTVDVLAEVYQILQKAGVEYNFYDTVICSENLDLHKLD